MFDMVGFIQTNLVEGYWNGSFKKQQVNIFAMNYMSQGMINQEEFEYILEAIEPKEEDELLT